MRLSSFIRKAFPKNLPGRSGPPIWDRPDPPDHQKVPKKSLVFDI
jgi:hypothetical protein